jgi:hypothetical protein
LKGGEMPKKNHYQHTSGQSLGDVSQRGDVTRFSRYQSKKEINLGGLNPKSEKNVMTPCFHYNIGLVKEGEDIYQCTNAFCGERFTVKKLKKGGKNV